MKAEWTYDDPSIPDDALLYRRVTKQPDNLVRDVSDGRRKVGIALFSYRADGLSIYASCLMDREGISDVELIDWTQEKLACVSTDVVRRSEPGDPYVGTRPPTGTVPAGEAHETGGGVVACVSSHPGDPRVQRSHGLVRIHLKPDSIDAKRHWNAFRVKLVMAALLKDSSSAGWTQSIA